MFMRAVHPGIVLKDELEELGITPTEFARQIDVPANRVSQIIAGNFMVYSTGSQSWSSGQTVTPVQGHRSTGRIVGGTWKTRV